MKVFLIIIIAALKSFCASLSPLPLSLSLSLQLPLLFEKKLKVPSYLASQESVAESFLSLRSLPASYLEVLGRHVASLPPGQAVKILQLHLESLREWCAGECVGVAVGVAIASCVEELDVILSHLPLSLWQGRQGSRAREALRSLVEEGCGQMLLLAKGELGFHRPAPLCISALLLLSRCCELLTRLQPHPLSSAELPEWPLQLEPSPSHQLLPKQWMGKGLPQLQPAVTVLLVSLSWLLQRHAISLALRQLPQYLSTPMFDISVLH